MTGLYQLTVTDHLEPALTGRAPCRYTTPPQPLDELRALAGVLLHGAAAPPVGVPAARAIAGGRRTVQITSAASGRRNGTPVTAAEALIA